MKIILLKDREDNSVDAVIVSETTTKKELNEILAGIIIDVAEGKEDNSYLEILKQRLPSDCKMIDRWSNDLNIIWY